MVSDTSKQPYYVQVEDVRVLVTPKRVKNVNFRVTAKGEPTMSVPLHVTRAQAGRLVQERKAWFRTAMERAARRREAAPVCWVDGERLRLWGTPHALRLEVCDGGRPSCEVVGGQLVLHVTPGMSVDCRAALVESYLKAQLRSYVDEILPACESRVGKAAASITLRRMATRWGSCTPKTGRIRLNVALAECPRACTETVLVHELCHLWESNHSRRFYALMDLHCPGWRAAQRWLDEHPSRV